MKIVTKSFLRYLPRRLSLSLLQLLGVACGVAAVVGMTLSARTALKSFTQAVEFLRGKATHSMQRPAGPMDENSSHGSHTIPRSSGFRRSLTAACASAMANSFDCLGSIRSWIDPSVPEIARPGIREQSSSNPENVFSFLLDDRAVLVDRELAAELGLAPGKILETARGPLHVVGTFPNPSGEPLILMDIGHAQKLYELKGQVDRIDLILSDESGFRSRWKDGFLIQSGRQRSQDLLRHARRLPPQP